ncbi:hypothetical protein HJD18_06340 [Thermoleophilia bacterium SCSIO 60948]|nr:hypothetical protein HJD18_06340 [Thermoleophilia bacterium SCSIO 60948]
MAPAVLRRARRADRAATIPRGAGPLVGRRRFGFGVAGRRDLAATFGFDFARPLVVFAGALRPGDDADAVARAEARRLPAAVDAR